VARKISTTIRLDEEDVRALKRARAAGHFASELVRKGLRVVASRYYTGRRAPSTRLFESTDTKLGDESELFTEIFDPEWWTARSPPSPSGGKSTEC
jgi:Arc/MetJ-type ribon-helix-helix transcriptional regulator